MTWLLPAQIICFLFVCFWIVSYPREICEILLFRGDDATWRILTTGIGTWLFFLLAVSLIVKLASLLP